MCIRDRPEAGWPRGPRRGAFGYCREQGGGRDRYRIRIRRRAGRRDVRGWDRPENGTAWCPGRRSAGMETLPSVARAVRPLLWNDRHVGRLPACAGILLWLFRHRGGHPASPLSWRLRTRRQSPLPACRRFPDAPARSASLLSDGRRAYARTACVPPESMEKYMCRYFIVSVYL